MTSNYIMEMRNLMNVLEGNKTLLQQFDKEFGLLRDKYMQLGTANHNVDVDGEIQTMYTGCCVKSRDPRKRSY